MSILFSPLKIGPIEVPNRIAVAPMCMYSAEDGCATDWHLQHMMTLAMSGCGAIIMEATGVAPEGRLTPGCLGLWSDDNERALDRVIAAARKVALPGVKFGIQLAHAGRKASSALPWGGGKPISPEQSGWRRLAPSAVAFGDGWPTPEPMDEAEIERVIAAYGEATRRAARAGFDIVEAHLAHGGLPHQFFSPIANKRNDAWGGDPDGRMRFSLELAASMKAAAPPNVALGARINGTDYIDGGLVLDDAIALAQGLKRKGLDFVCVSGGNIVPGGRPVTGVAFNVPNAARVKQEAGLVTRTAGLIYDAKQAEEILARGDVDQIAIARGVLDDPRWGWHAAEKLGVKIDVPKQYGRVGLGQWAGAKLVRPVA